MGFLGFEKIYLLLLVCISSISCSISIQFIKSYSNNRRKIFYRWSKDISSEEYFPPILFQIAVITKTLESNQLYACCLHQQQNSSFSIISLKKAVQQINNDPQLVVESSKKREFEWFFIVSFSPNIFLLFMIQVPIQSIPDGLYEIY